MKKIKIVKYDNDGNLRLTMEFKLSKRMSDDKEVRQKYVRGLVSKEWNEATRAITAEWRNTYGVPEGFYSVRPSAIREVKP